MNRSPAAPAAPAPPALDLQRIRAQFPILDQQVGDRRLVYLDSAATTQKPIAVIEAEREYYRAYNSNVHRGVHRLSVLATEAYEAARTKVARFLGAAEHGEIVFTRGATEAINLVAQSWARTRLGAGDEILISEMEHHSNIVPWQMVRDETGAKLVVAPIDDDGEIRLDELRRRIGPRTRLVAVAQASNALGTVNPIAEIAAMAREVGARVLVDGAQAVAHMPVNVHALGCDFYVASGHKMFAPTGTGFLWAKPELLEEMPPWMGGGDMIRSVTFERTLYAPPPAKFEAGTPNIAGSIALGAAVDWIRGVGIESIAAHEHDLLEYGREALERVPGLHLVGRPRQRSGVLSFTLEGIHPHDAGTVLDHEGIAVRTGHHCAQPVMERFGVPATIRASLSVYNGRDDLDRLVEGLARVRAVLGGD